MKRAERRSGFTIVEIIAVIALISILAAVTIPSLISFFRHGKQINRTNIARTIHLAVQNQLTVRAGQRTLRTTLTASYYSNEDGEIVFTPGSNNVRAVLGEEFPESDEMNAEYVHYVSKPKGYIPTEGDTSERAEFYRILNDVISDKIILDDAILMEYNVETGVVMSIFYSEKLNAGEEFGYYGAANRPDNVYGGRGENGYEYAKARDQGYSGVETTGSIQAGLYMDTVNIYDGGSPPAWGNVTGLTNILYAELILASPEMGEDGLEQPMPRYELKLVDAESGVDVLDCGYVNLPEAKLSTFSASSPYYYDDDIEVEQNGIKIGTYRRYIWVIDYIGGDTHNQPDSVGEKYGIDPRNVRVKATRENGNGTVSLTVANTHFGSERSDGSYEVRTARHLNNIRYAPGGSFRQVVHIDMQDPGNEITNFRPIEEFSGTYVAIRSNGTQYRISGLMIDTVGKEEEIEHVGLFGESSGTIRGVSLYKADIRTGNGQTTGAIAGHMTGGTIVQSNSYARVRASGSGSTGGLVGRITSGTLELSFNAGYYRVESRPTTESGYGSVNGEGAATGGLVGRNDGIIRDCFNNARVNIASVLVTDYQSHTPENTSFTGSGLFGGIAGRNDGTITNVYATNFTALYPGSTTGGITGGGSGSVTNSYFVSNGAIGDNSITKEILAANPMGSMFNAGRTYTRGNNMYSDYPYPVLRNNNPFNDALDWGWEDIQVVYMGDSQLRYYEIYNDGTIGYSDDGTLADREDGTNRLVVNDGYVLQFDYAAELRLSIGNASFNLSETAGGSPVWAWTGVVAGGLPVPVTDAEGDEYYNLFLDNTILETISGGEYISFSAEVPGKVIANTRFNPMFADTVGKTGTAYAVRSPRHLDNVDSALDGTFSQMLNIEFAGYSKNMSGIGTAPKMVFDGGVVRGDLTGTYDGSGLYVSGVEARCVFEGIGLGGVVEGFVMKDGTIKAQNNTAGGIALINNGRIERSEVNTTTVTAAAEVGGVAAVNNGIIADVNVRRLTVLTTFDFAGGIVGRNDGEISGSKVTEASSVRGMKLVGGIAGTSPGAISGCVVEGIVVTGLHYNVGGIAGRSDSMITDSAARETTVQSIGSGENVGGIAGHSTGGISGGVVEGVTVSGIHDNVGGIAGNSESEISDCTVTGADVRNLGSGGNIGGIVGSSTGAISDCVVESTGVLGIHTNVGGIAGRTTESITDSKFLSGSVANSGGGGNIGGIVGSSTSMISGCETALSTVSGIHNNIGGIAGNGMGSITDSKVSTVNISTAAGGNAGGIAGQSESGIVGCRVSGVTVSGLNNNIGGVAGRSTGAISDSSVSYSMVTSTAGGATGGVVGENRGVVSDVFFLSTRGPGDEPVSAPHITGGIIGDNRGRVARAIYLAPAPNKMSGSTKTIYPIVGSGTPAEESEYGEETCFYLTGNRYSLNEGVSWINEDYNRVNSEEPRVIRSGGGAGLVTKFIDSYWLTFAYNADFSRWSQPPVGGYPYPILSNMQVPNQWPVTDSPVRPDQRDRDDWSESLSTSNRAANVNFINGDFEMPLMNPNNPLELYDVLRTEQITQAPNSQNENITGGFNGNMPYPPMGSDGSDYYGMYVYLNSAWVQGWNTRPVDQSNGNNGYGNPLWNMIEYQRPYSSNLANNRRLGRVRTNYEGGLTGTYIELNAQIPGTLYQICPTVPGTETYYSFYHARRNAGNEVGGHQRMNFYLSGMVLGADGWEYSNGTGRPTIIRPCITPRGTSLNSSTTRNTVVYGTTSNNAEETINVGRVDFYDPNMNDGEGGVRNAFLTDVWLSDMGYGISFWTESAPVIGSGSDRIPLGGVSNIDALPGSLRTAARNNVIGYWHVRQFSTNQFSEWKQYYGLYTIPEGQITTEFAYESASARNPREGNYLDGITFRAPSYLSIDKYVRYGGDDVMFVKPEDTITVMLAVKNWGEVSANNIEVTDRLAPFDDYIRYVSGSVTLNDAPLTDGIIEPNASNNQTLTIRLPQSEELVTNSEMVITFDITVNREVAGSEGVSTLLYYFRNQASISYYDVEFGGFSAANADENYIKRNASGPEPVQVFIDPIKLTKTVTPLGDRTFNIEISVENTLSEGNQIETNGMITDVVPNGFVIIDRSGLPGDTGFTKNSDGSERITIRGVSVTDTIREKTYSYKTAYVGTGYGVSYISTTADYKYLFNDGAGAPMNVMLRFPQKVVGLAVQTTEDYVTHSGSETLLLDILENDFMQERLTDDNYDITPEVVLIENIVLSEDGIETGETAQQNPNGDYQINHNAFTVTLLKTTNQVQFTPKSGANGLYEFYYQVRLTARKIGGALNNYDLSSPITKVTVFVIGDDTLTYYEKYDDGTYGFYAGTSAMPEELSGTKKITEYGYAVLSVKGDQTVTLNGGGASGEPDGYNGIYLYKIDTRPQYGLGLSEIGFGTQESMTELGTIHQNFAKAIYPVGADSNGVVFSIRTAQQMRNVGYANDENTGYTLERDIDFGGIKHDDNTAIVTGIFRGVFEGNGYTVRNVVIETEKDNAGLFEENRGVIKNIVLAGGGVTRISGGQKVGGIVGSNHGQISACTVIGESEAYIDIDAENYAGAIAGYNGSEGTIAAVNAKYVHVEVQGSNAWSIAGGNENIAENSVLGTVEDVVIIRPIESELIESPPEPEPQSVEIEVTEAGYFEEVEITQTEEAEEAEETQDAGITREVTAILVGAWFLSPLRALGRRRVKRPKKRK